MRRGAPGRGAAFAACAMTGPGRLRPLMLAAAAVAGLGGSDTLGAGSLGSTTFEVTAQLVSASCELEVDSLDFGTYDGNVAIEKDGQIRVTCTAPGTYLVKASPGPFAGSGSFLRLLTAPGGATLRYNVTAWLAGGVPWYDFDEITVTLGSPGEAAVIYTRGWLANWDFDEEPLPPPGTYTDNITVTVYF
jgi:spore coat protein U-like protein